MALLSKVAKVGDALAGDVGRCHGLARRGPASPATQRRRRQHAQRAGDHRSLIRQNIAEHILGTRRQNRPGD